MKETAYTPANIYQSWTKEAHKLINPNSNKKLDFDLLSNKQFLTLMEHAPTVILIINHLHSTYEYCSKNMKSLVGYSAEEMIAGGVTLGTSFIAEEHAPVFGSSLIPSMFEHMEFYKRSGDLKKVRFSYNFKTKRRDGIIIWILQHMTIIETDETGGALLSMIFMADITSFKKDTALDFSISKLNEAGYFQPVFTTSFPVDKEPGEKIIFTSRELDIIALINNGYSSIQIADKLCLSEHTVSTHRKNIRKKLRVANTSELINTLKMKGLME